VISDYHFFYVGPSAKSNGKEKDKASVGTRQATLFGMLPKGKDKQKNPFGRKTGDITASQTDATQSLDSQATDVMMSDAPTLVETSQAPDKSGWEETQMVQDGDGTQVCMTWPSSFSLGLL